MQNGSQYSVEESNTDDIIISSRDIDSNYEPSVEEIKQYGAFLGMDPEEDTDFLYIAKKGLKASIPPPWKACQRKDGQIYYFNFETGESQWEHPYDEECRKEFQNAKRIALSKEKKEEGSFNYSEFSQDNVIEIMGENGHGGVIGGLEEDNAGELKEIIHEFEVELKKNENQDALKFGRNVTEISKVSKKQSGMEIETQDEVQIEQDFQAKRRELEEGFEQESRMIEEQSTKILNDEIKRIQQEYDLLINAEIMKLGSSEMESERSKTLVRSGNNEKKLRIELSEEYSKRLMEMEIELKNKFESESIEFKLQKAKEFSEKSSWRGSNLQDLKREYEIILEQEKLKLYLKAQKTIENLKTEQSHSVFLNDTEKGLRADFDTKVKRIDIERIQHSRDIHNSLDAKHRQLQRIYELEKLSLQNSSNEVLQGSQREIKNLERDLKTRENFINTCNLQKEQVRAVEKEIIQKDNMIHELVMKIKEAEVTVQEYNMQIQQYQSRLEAHQFPNNNKVLLLQRIAEMHERLDSIQNELKAEKIKPRIENIALNSQGIGKNNVSRLLRELKGIKTSIIQKNKRNSFTPSHKPVRDLSPSGQTDTFLLTNSDALQVDLFTGKMVSSEKEKRSASTGNRYKAGQISMNNYASVGYTSIGNETRKSLEKDLSYLSTINYEKVTRKRTEEDQARNWSVLNDSSTLGPRDQNIQRDSSLKKESNLYGRSTLQNNSEIVHKPGYPKDIFYAKKGQWGLSSESKPLNKQELIGSVQLRNKYKNEKIFRQYDNLIKKYSSK